MSEWLQLLLVLVVAITLQAIFSSTDPRDNQL